MGASITLDDSLWPLLICRFEGKISDSQFEEYLTRGTAYLQRGERHVNIMDMSQLAMPTPAQRQRQTEWLKASEALMQEHLIGCAMIVTSPFIRLAVSAVFHLKPLPAPYVVVPNMRSGLQWATAQLEEAGLPKAAGSVRRHFGQQLLPGSP